MPWRCFLVEPAEKMYVYLRRYHSSSDDTEHCSGPYGYHNARAFMCEHSQSIDRENGHWVRSEVPEPSHDDERWPQKCDYCEYVFVDEDEWQVHDEYLWVRRETNEHWGLSSMPPGAMFDNFWEQRWHQGPDGRCLAVMLPPGGAGHYWTIDGPSRDGGYWTRQGTPPNITVSPSILTGSYHGFLQNGLLTDSLDDRPMPPGPDQ